MTLKEEEKPAAEDILVLPESGWEWVVVRTRPRCEKKMEHFCHTEKIPVYLPLRSRTHRYGGRRRTYTTPLFGGYMFCQVDPQHRQIVQQNHYCARMLRVLEQDVLVQQLRQVRLALETNAVTEVMPFLKKGRMVRIVSGPLKGAEGIVQRIKGKTRVVLNVDLIQQAVAMEVDSQDLAPG